jgi:hypothetical protein
MDKDEAQEFIRKIEEVHQHTDPKEYDPELVEKIKKAAHDTFAFWGATLPGLEVSYIRELAEHVYAVRYTYKLSGPLSTQDQGIYVDYFASTLFLESQTVTRLVNKLLDQRLGKK